MEYGALPLHQRTLLVAIIFGATRMGHEAALVFLVLTGYLVFANIKLAIELFILRQYGRILKQEIINLRDLSQRSGAAKSATCAEVL